MKKRYFLTSTTAAALAAIAFAPTADAATFKDIKNHPYEQEIISLASSNIINGYPDNTFQPNRTLSRSDVVKILGKYLMSIGFTVPKDYNSNMRFKDLHKNSNDELLRYAAVVKDAGVFVGSSGNLMPTQIMKREHMALVLVRAFSQIHRFDYVNYVANESFLQDFLDEEFLTKENEGAIRVFDYFDITVDDYFRPKAAATRGDFSGALYKMMHINQIVLEEPTIERVDVITTDRVTVTMTDGEKHNIRLDQPLAENVPTEITFELYGKRYKQTVTYKVAPLQILNVRNINGAQFVVQFNQPVDMANVYNQSDLEKIFTFRVNKYSYNIPLSKGELSSDKRSITITVNSSTAFLADYYRLTLRGSIHAENGTTLKDYTNIYSFTKDTERPSVVGVEHLNNSRVRVHFSEPINHGRYLLSFKTFANEPITGIGANYTSNGSSVELNLTNAKINGTRTLSNDQTLYGTFSNLTDIAGNVTSVATVQFKKTNPDGVMPRLLDVEQLSAKQFKLIFSEPMLTPLRSSLNVSSNGETNYVEEIEPVEGDSTAFIVTTENYLDGRTIIETRYGYYVYDVSGQQARIYTIQQFSFDTSKAQLERTDVTREHNSEYLNMYFSRNIVIGDNATIQFTGGYTLNGQRSYINLPKVARVYADPTNPKVARILLSEMLDGVDRENATYDVTATLTNVKNEYQIEMDNEFSFSFKREKDFNFNYHQLKVESVETSRTNANIKDSKTIVVNFDYNVDAETATNLLNYDLKNYTLLSATVNPTNYKQVILTFNNPVYSPTEVYLSIDDVRAQNAITRMEPYYERVYLNENISPILYSSTGSMLDGKTVLSSSIHTASNELTLSFSEAIATLPADSFVVTTSTGEALPVTTAVSTKDPSKVVLTFASALRRGQTLTINLKPNRQITDLYYNASPFRIGTVTPYNYY